MNAKEFKRILGREPEQDDLDRVNCQLAGQTGHSDCGWCKTCNHPNFECLCPAEGKTIFLPATMTERESLPTDQIASADDLFLIWNTLWGHVPASVIAAKYDTLGEDLLDLWQVKHEVTQ